MLEKNDKIGQNYNSTRKADPYLLSRMAAHLQTKAGKTYLDIGCGTCNYTGSLQQGAGDFIGIDPSLEMLKKAEQSRFGLRLIQGHAEKIPLQNSCIDGALASLTLHHWTSLEQGFSELHRVLKPKSRLVIFTATQKQMAGYWLNHYFPKMMSDSIAQMPTLGTIEDALTSAGFEFLEKEKYFVRPDLQDLFLYAGKDDPSLYFDCKVRQGISSFSALSNAGEVAQGLEKLQNDIASKAFGAIKKQYENRNGDYVFLVFKS